ncbi:LamG domain-containing protein [Taibaiella koreensis]|uniref:LamG domain-containing protein n=1 Tax=Taibaiella koreensis TaxID=1268548 RepID=UPI000E59ABB4|nr:LamG domain-containing protein [Taibaiella koreensis]
MNQLSKRTAIAVLACLASCGKQDGKTRDIACLPSSLSTNVIAFYPFSSGSLLDRSGNNRHLVGVGAVGPDADRDNNPQCAYVLNNTGGNTAYLTCPDPTFLNNLSGLSVSAWYTITDSLRYGGSYTTLVSRDTAKACPDRGGQWSLGLYDCSRAVFGMYHSVWDQMITSPVSCEKEMRLRYHSWHHAVATYDKATMSIAIYRDGVLQETRTGVADCGSGAPLVRDIGDLMLGYRFTGKLDDVALFDKALTQQEVSALYNSAPCCSTYVE